MATPDPPGCRVERCAAGCGPPGDDFAIPLRLTLVLSASFSSAPSSAVLLSTLRRRRRATRSSASSLFRGEEIVFISTVVRMDGVPVIYVPAQTHLIYSTKHNSLTLFRGKVLVYLGYAGKSREFHAWHARMSNLPASARAFSHISPSVSPPTAFRLIRISLAEIFPTDHSLSRVDFTPFGFFTALSLSLSLSLLLPQSFCFASAPWAFKAGAFVALCFDDAVAADNSATMNRPFLPRTQTTIRARRAIVLLKSADCPGSWSRE